MYQHLRSRLTGVATAAALCLALTGCVVEVGITAIDVTNDIDLSGAGVDIVELWLGDAGSTTDGFTTQLSAGLPLGPGETLSIVAIDAGGYALLAIDELGNNYVRDPITVTTGDTTTVVFTELDLAVEPGPSTGELHITNGIEWSDSSSVLVELYIDPAGGTWTTERLGGVTVDPGGTAIVSDLEPGDYDILGVDQDGLYFALYNIEVYAGDQTLVTLTSNELAYLATIDRGTPEVAGTGWLRVKNGIDYLDGASYLLVQMYLAEAPVTDWGDDLLTEAIAPGADVLFAQVVEGTWEIYAVDDAGNAYLREDVPVFEGAETTVTLTIEDIDQ